MTTLHVKVEGKAATYLRREGAIVCGNNDYRIAFAFDDEWAGYENKTARFIWGGTYFDVDFTGTECDVPAIPFATEVAVGLYVSDSVRTTTSAVIPCVPSILSGGEAPNPGYGAQYVNDIKRAAADAEGAADEAEASERAAAGSATAAQTAAASAAAAATSAEASEEQARAAADETKGAVAIANSALNFAVKADTTATAALEKATQSEKKLAETTSAISKRMENLERGLTPDPFVTDREAAYAKAVPQGALPFAQVDAVGGLTHKKHRPVQYDLTGLIGDTGSSGELTVTATSIERADPYLFSGMYSQDETTERTLKSIWPDMKAGRTYTLSWKGGGTGTYLAPCGVVPESAYVTSVTFTATELMLNQSLWVHSHFEAGGEIYGGSATFTDVTLLGYGDAYLVDTKVTALVSANAAGAELGRIAIPAAVQALDGYGWGISPDAHNGVEWDETGKARFVKRVGRRTFDGTDPGWAGSTANGVYFAFRPEGIAYYGDIRCNKFPEASPSTPGVAGAYLSGNALNFFPGSTSMTDEEWKAKLAEWAAAGEPLTVYYPLATPVVTDVSHLVTLDNLVKVVPGGKITAQNEHGDAAPSTVIYQIKQ